MTKLLSALMLTCSSLALAAPKASPLPKKTMAEKMGLEKSPDTKADEAAVPASADAENPRPNPFYTSSTATETRPNQRAAKTIEMEQGGPLTTWPRGPVVKKTETEAAKKDDIEIEEDAFFDYARSRVSPRLHVGVGYVVSRWSSIDPALKNGSMALTIGGSREFGQSWEGGLGFTFLSGTDSGNNGDNVYANALDLNARWFFWPGRFKPFLGASLGFGSFRAWSLKSETNALVVYAKHAGGYMAGLTPTLGMRFNLSPALCLDLAMNYGIYYPSAAAKTQGFGIFATLGFARY